MMKAQRHVTLYLCGLLWLLATVSVRAERLPVRIYTSADGLGSSFVSNLMRDSHGFLWLCTRDGLSRFDGVHFVTYQVSDRNAPPGIEQMLETSKGIYWIVTTGGLYRFDPAAAPATNSNSNTDRPILNAELMGEQRAVIYEDRHGNLWAGGDGLYQLTEKDGKIYAQQVELHLPANPASEFAVVAIREGQDGSLWLVTSWGLVRRLPDGREIFYRASARTDASISVLADRAGRIWLGRTSGVYIIKPEPLAELARLGGLTVRELDGLAKVQTHGESGVSLPERAGEIFKYTGLGSPAYGKYLYQTTDGHIWISAGDGVIEYDGRALHAYTPAQGLLKGGGQMVEDATGNLWLGWPNGLMRLDRRGLTTYDLADGLKNLAILTINESQDGKLNVATNDFYLSRFVDKGFETLRPPLPPAAKALWTANPIYQDHMGEWWLLTNEKLYRFAAAPTFAALAGQRPLATYTSRDGLKGDQLFHIFEDSQGALWVSVRGANSAQIGLSRWTRATDKFYTFSAAENFPPAKSTSAFAEDRAGNLWVGFYEGGLARYAANRFTEFTTVDGVPDGLITALHLDRQGRLWVASALSGLSRLDDPSAAHPRFVTVTTDNGLASNNVRSLTEDAYGNIYAGTARGIDKLAPDATRIQHYSVKDGLAGDFVNVAFRDRTGALWFGTPNGLSRLVPEARRDTSAPAVWLGGLRIAGESRPLPELGSAELSDLELAHTQNSLQIDFFGIDFNAGGALRYEYMLEGADRAWSAPTEQRTVNYANLAPGSYRFLVKAGNDGGLAAARPAMISFRILPPVWRRWWFLTLAAALIGLALYRLDRFRSARLDERRRAEESLRRVREERIRELERVRTRIATDLHDDIGSSLTQISILSEVVRQRLGDKEAQAAQPLQLIATSSRELVDSMSDIVWAINPEKDHLSDLTQRMRRFASDVFTARNIEFRLLIPGAEQDIQMGANMRRELFLVFKEGINNMIKHSGCTAAEIEFQIEAERLALRLSDNGKGFDPTLESDGHGLMSMRERAKSLGGQLEFVSQQGTGTTVTLKVPLNSTQPMERA